ncbi:MAG: hypothetical protein ACYC1D_06115 [Acidimicrobiales bacterium]
MSVASAPLARQVEARARRDPAFAELIDSLLRAPASPAGRLQQVAAEMLNDQRRAAVMRDFVEGALPTPKVQALLELGSPQAVHRLRSRGRLVGAARGNQTWFPAWQFDTDRARPDLPRILEAVRHFSAEPLAIDRVMRLAHDDLDGLSIADALRRPALAERAWRLLAAIGA